MGERWRRRRAAAWLVPLVLASSAGLGVAAKDAEPAAPNPQIEAQMMDIAAELRCLVCQNQTIADSHADLAVDLRQQIRELLAKGMSDAQIRRYMTDRYGDFVLYRPPFMATTALLWIGPGVLMGVAIGSLLVVLRRRQRMAADAFDPETDDDEDAADNTQR